MKCEKMSCAPYCKPSCLSQCNQTLPTMKSESVTKQDYCQLQIYWISGKKTSLRVAKFDAIIGKVAVWDGKCAQFDSRRHLISISFNSAACIEGWKEKWF